MNKPLTDSDLLISHERLLEVVRYDPATGVFRFNIRQGRQSPGNEAGSLNKNNGYRSIHLDGRRYLTHRLAWFYVHKEWPYPEIDHINRVRDDNRIANLRIATKSQNLANSIRRNPWDKKGYFKSLTRAGTVRWAAAIRIHGESVYLGKFDTPEEARDAYQAAAWEAYGDFVPRSYAKAAERQREGQ